MTTSKACQQIGVNLVVKLVTFMMNIEQKGAKLHKRIEKLEWEIRNEVLSKKQKQKKKEQIKEIIDKIEALGTQLIPLKVTKLVTKAHNQ